MLFSKKELAQLQDDFSASINWEEVSDTIFYTCNSHFGFKNVLIAIADEDTDGSFRIMSSTNESQKGLEIPYGHVVIQTLQSTLNPEILVATPKASNEINQFAQWLDIAAVVPLMVHGGMRGLLLVGTFANAKKIKGKILKDLTALAPYIARAVYHAYLYLSSLEQNKQLRAQLVSAQEELTTTNIQLRHLDKAKSEFLSIASHQLYTPLTALRGYVSMLEEGDFGKLAEKQLEILRILDRSATRLIDLIKNLLDISKIESGRLELNLESVDIVDMTRELVADLLPNAMTKKLKLEFHEPKGGIPNVVVDRQRIRQVMLNLVDNAIKYTQKGRIDVKVWQLQQKVIFSVKDTGKGIKVDEVKRLFEKFARVGGSERFHTEGTGLGLYVARQIVKEHRGEIQVDSAGEGQGSTFSMQLPVEGSPESLRAGETAEVTIKAAEAINA